MPYTLHVANIRTINRLKLKRPQTAKKYRNALDEMYAEAEALSSTKAKL